MDPTLDPDFTQSTHPKTKKQSPSHWSGYFGYYGAYFCVFFVILTLFIVLVTVPWYLARTDNLAYTLNQQIAQMNSDRQSDDNNQMISSKLITLSSILSAKTVKVLSLCHLGIYYTKKGAQNDTFHKVDESIDEVSNRTMKDYYYYPTSVKVRMTFNSHLNTPQLRVKENNKDILIDYNVTSSYIYFSTIALQELQFNIDEYSVKKTRTILLCSNNPDYVNIRRCDVLRYNKMKLHQSKRVPLLNNQENFANSNYHDPSISNTTGDDEDEDDIDGVSDEYDHDDAQFDEIKGLRMYNIVFFKELDPDTPTRGGNGQRSAKGTYKEERILTIEPNIC